MVKLSKTHQRMNGIKNQVHLDKLSILTVVNGLATHFLGAGFSAFSAVDTSTFSTFFSSSSREPHSSSTILTLTLFLPPGQLVWIQPVLVFCFGFRIFREWRQRIKGTLLNRFVHQSSSLVNFLNQLSCQPSSLVEWRSAHCHWFSTSPPHWMERGCSRTHNSWKNRQRAKYNHAHAHCTHVLHHHITNMCLSPCEICGGVYWATFVALQGARGEAARVTLWLLPPTDSGARTL